MRPDGRARAHGMRRVALLSIACAVLLVVAPSAWADGYVDRASVGGPCDDSRTFAEASSAATPWCTIDRAVESAPGGAVVRVRAGSYPRLGVFRSRDVTEPVTLKAFEGERPELAGVEVQHASFLRFEGFRFTDQSLVAGSDHIDFVANDFSPSGLEIIQPQDSLVEGNTFHDLPHTRDNEAAPVGFGLFVNSLSDDPDLCCADSGLIIRNNKFTRTEDDAIQLGGGANDVVIEGNEFSDIHPSFTAHADAIQLVGTSGTVIRNNFIHDSASALMLVHS